VKGANEMVRLHEASTLATSSRQSGGDSEFFSRHGIAEIGLRFWAESGSVGVPIRIAMPIKDEVTR
jgi:hypothetical protein